MIPIMYKLNSFMDDYETNKIDQLFNLFKNVIERVGRGRIDDNQLKEWF